MTGTRSSRAQARQGVEQEAREVGALLAAAQCKGGPCRYVLMNVGEPLNEQMMKEADENGDRTLNYEGEQRMGPGSPVGLLTCPSALSVQGMMTGESFKLVQ